MKNPGDVLETNRRIEKLWEKYREMFLYLVFGAGTTLVNIVVYYTCTHFLHFRTISGNCLAWLLSVLFAYITNKVLVFGSSINRLGGVVREMISFFSSRIATGFLDLLLMYLCVDVWKWNDMLMKILVNVIVIALNYAASKMWVFKGSGDSGK